MRSRKSGWEEYRPTRIVGLESYLGTAWPEGKPEDKSPKMNPIAPTVIQA